MNDGTARVDSARKPAIRQVPGEPAPIGVLSSKMKDHAYVMDGGVMFTTPWLTTRTTLRRCGAISLTAAGAPFELSCRGVTTLHQVTAVRPMVSHRLKAEDVKLVTLLINPLHPMFRMFRGITGEGVASIGRGAFGAYDALLHAAYQGKLEADAARTLFNGVIQAVAQHLPRGAQCRSDDKVDHAMTLLQVDAHRSLGEIAREVGVSYGRMSHMFTQSMGISLRNYQLWLKVHNGLNLMDTQGTTFTEIAETAGFADLAHFSRVAGQALGAPLSYFRASEQLQKIYCNG